MTLFFGEPWPSGICDEGTQGPTPIGSDCGLCEEQIVAGDQGSFMNGVLPVHRECSLRAVMGGIEHLTAEMPHPVGSCYDGSTLTYRESSLQAWDWHQTHRESA